MPPRKKTGNPNAISNVNTNNNNVHVNVNLEHPKTNSAKKPNWIVKTIVVGIIGMALSLLGYYLKKYYDSGQKNSPPTIQNGTPAITGKKTS